MPSPDVFYRDDAVLYADVQGIWLMLMFGPPDAARMRRAGPTLAEMSKRYPHGFCNLTVITPSAGIAMDAESRQAAADLTMQYSSFMKCDVNVIDGEGFWPATVRAILAAVHVLSRVRHPRHAVRTLDEAMDLTIKYLPAESKPRFDRATALEQAKTLLASVKTK